jgi:putative ABC transport system substrate-binding protein
MTTRLSRRQIVLGAGISGAALLLGCGRLPWQGQEQPPERLARIGYLAASSRELTNGTEAFLQGMADHGYVEGRNLTIEWRFADGMFGRMPDLAAELVRLQPEVIVVPHGSDALVVSNATSAIPIVVAETGGDLVSFGLATSLAHPGGNVTGMNTPNLPLTGKRLQLLTEAMPGLSRVAALFDPTMLGILPTESGSLTPEDYERFAQTLGVSLLRVDARAPEELESAFEAASRGHADALFVPGQSLMGRNRARIIALAAGHRLPAMYGSRAFVEDGGLMSYEHRIADSHRRAASYVDRILKGARPADLPVEQPMRFDFVVNLSTARALGITFPNEIMLQVTEVIQ